MKYTTTLGVVAAMLALSAGAAQAGNSCFRKVSTPPVYQTYAQQVLVSPARTHFHKIPAQYATVTKQVLVRPAQRIAHHVPAVTRSVAQTVMIAPATKVWSVTRDAHGREVGCWVKKPAQFATQYRTVVVQPASVSYSVVPAEYRTIAHQVEVRPAQLIQRTTPAVYATRTQTAMVAPGRTGWQPIPAHCR